MQTDSLEKSLVLEKIAGRRRRGYQRMRWLDSITDAMNMNLDKLQEMLRDRKAWHAAVHGVAKNWTWLCDWTTVWESFISMYMKKPLWNPQVKAWAIHLFSDFRPHLLLIQRFKETYLTSLTSVSRSVTWLITIPISYSSEEVCMT